MGHGNRYGWYNDEINIFTFPAFNVANTYTQAQANSLFLKVAGGTLTGNVDTTSNGYFQVPIGTTAQRPSATNKGYIRYNTDYGSFEGYSSGGWGSIGAGAKGGGNNQVFFENDQTVTANYTITTGKNAMSVGPISISSGVTVTIPSSSKWVVL